MDDEGHDPPPASAPAGENRYRRGKRRILFGLPALSICALYKSRWQVELFFKWIKQHLRIKRFFGTSENAVKSQVWIAVATYVLVAIVKKRLKLGLSLHAMLQILSVTPFEKTPLSQLFSDMPTSMIELGTRNQLKLL